MAPDERQARMVLSGLSDFGPVSIRRLIDHCGSAQAALRSDPDTLGTACSAKQQKALRHWRERFDLTREESLLERHRARYITAEEEGYPPLLRTLHDAPVGLYWQGPARCGERAVAIVGTRRPSAYGRKIAREFSAELARLGFTVVSGLAAGIDAEAHTAALNAGGSTIALLGNGLDITYPRENARLFERMRAEAAIASEFYFGRVADRQTFPQRNRIVSGMSQCVLVVESGGKGGSLITARFAAEQGRSVCAMPGRIDMPSFEGCHALIRDGATLVHSFGQLLEEIHGQGRQLDLLADMQKGKPPPDPGDRLPGGLTDEETAIARHFLDGDCLHPDHIVDRADVPPHAVHAALLMLELKGVLAKRPDGTYERAF
ncbi:MAG: DNA-processing protein DprA [Opitutales bacterium]|nr:DNA-processing protein DprA [Opitutales bacterium]